MRNIYVCLLLISPLFCSSQSISPDRVAKFRSAVVRISIEGTDKMGTGFFISQDGLLLTNWHVIKPALISSSTGPASFKKIVVEFMNGYKGEVKVLPDFISDNSLGEDALTHDFIILKPVTQPPAFSYFQIGTFDDVLEGEEVITCGYPLGITKQFISQGIVSTKFKDSSVMLNSQLISNDCAYLDLTMNRGNSGGPIIRKGKTLNDDRVVGIAEFILVPFGRELENLEDQIARTPGTIQLDNFDVKESSNVFTKALSLASNGLSGCISIDYPSKALTSRKKQLAKQVMGLHRP